MQTFYPLFALLVTTSVQLVGLYLVFASLILPALAASVLTGRGALLAAWCVGLAGYAAGILLSVTLDWPTGPAIVCSLALVALPGSLLFSRFNRR